MTLDDVRSIELHHRHVLMHFEEVLGRLDPEDEFHGVLRDWIAAQRQAARPPKVQRLTERVADLERQLEHAREEAEALRDSTSWRVTRPLRAVSGRARGLRG